MTRALSLLAAVCLLALTALVLGEETEEETARG
jgi:hypothetical protein